MAPVISRIPSRKENDVVKGWRAVFGVLCLAASAVTAADAPSALSSSAGVTAARAQTRDTGFRQRVAEAATRPPGEAPPTATEIAALRQEIETLRARTQELTAQV